MHRIENTDIKQRGQDAARRRRRDLGVVHRHDDEGHRHDDVDAACLVLPCARRSSPLVAASVSKSGAAGSVSGGGGGKRRRCLAALSCVCPVVSWMQSKADGGKSSAPVLDDSIMSWYLSMDNGKFWFPAQVYNREVPSHVLSFTS